MSPYGSSLTQGTTPGPAGLFPRSHCAAGLPARPTSRPGQGLVGRGVGARRPVPPPYDDPVAHVAGPLLRDLTPTTSSPRPAPRPPPTPANSAALSARFHRGAPARPAGSRPDLARPAPARRRPTTGQSSRSLAHVARSDTPSTSAPSATTAHADDQRRRARRARPGPTPRPGRRRRARAPPAPSRRLLRVSDSDLARPGSSTQPSSKTISRRHVSGATSAETHPRRAIRCPDGAVGRPVGRGPRLLRRRRRARSSARSRRPTRRTPGSSRPRTLPPPRRERSRDVGNLPSGERGTRPHRRPGHRDDVEPAWCRLGRDHALGRDEARLGQAGPAPAPSCRRHMRAREPP